VFKAEGPQDTKNGAYFIKKVSIDNEWHTAKSQAGKLL
jgi:hypothetical protein